jgi:alpha-D-xyloside xylohydrolase
MKFTDGFWQTRPGVTPLYAQEAYDMVAGENSLTVTATTKVIEGRGDTLDCPTLTVTLSSPLPNIVRVRIEHFHRRSDQGISAGRQDGRAYPPAEGGRI